MIWFVVNYCPKIEVCLLVTRMVIHISECHEIYRGGTSLYYFYQNIVWSMWNAVKHFLQLAIRNIQLYPRRHHLVKAAFCVNLLWFSPLWLVVLWLAYPPLSLAKGNQFCPIRKKTTILVDHLGNVIRLTFRRTRGTLLGDELTPCKEHFKGNEVTPCKKTL